MHRKISRPHTTWPTTDSPSYTNRLQVETGYKIELVASELMFPTSVTFDNKGFVYVGESGFSYGPVKVEGGGKIKKIHPSGQITVIAQDFDGPLTGVTWHRGLFYVATGSFPGKIHVLNKQGERKVLIDGLPTGGDHFTSNIIFDGYNKMYFGNGTRTNSAVVGIDNFMMGWLANHLDWHDIPPIDYVLIGENYGLKSVRKSSPVLSNPSVFQQAPAKS